MSSASLITHSVATNFTLFAGALYLAMTSIRRINPARPSKTYVLLTSLPILTYAKPIPQNPDLIPIQVNTDPKAGYLSRIDPITLATLILLIALILALLAYWLYHHEKKKRARAAEENRREEDGRRQADELAQREKDNKSVNGRDWGAPPSKKLSKPEGQGAAPNHQAPFGEPRSRKSSKLSPNEPSSAPTPGQVSRVSKDAGPPTEQAGEPQSRKTSKAGTETVPPNAQPGEVPMKKGSKPEKSTVPPKQEEPQPKRLSSVTEREEKDVRSTV